MSERGLVSASRWCCGVCARPSIVDGRAQVAALATTMVEPLTLDAALKLKDDVAIAAVERICAADPEAAKTPNAQSLLPLHVACRKKLPLPVVRELLAAHPTAASTADKNGFTPLHWAAIRGLLEMTRHLLAIGANPALQDKHGNTAHTLAFKKGFMKVANTIKEHQDGSGAESAGTEAQAQECSRRPRGDGHRVPGNPARLLSSAFVAANSCTTHQVAVCVATTTAHSLLSLLCVSVCA